MWNLLFISFGTASIVSLFVSLWAHVVDRDAKTRRKGWIFTIGFVLLTAIVFKWGPDATSAGQQSQSGSVRINGRTDTEFNIYYSKPYKTSPNLNVGFMTGNGNIEITEQRADGFKFKVGEYAYANDSGAKIAWNSFGNLKD